MRAPAQEPAILKRAEFGASAEFGRARASPAATEVVHEAGEINKPREVQTGVDSVVTFHRAWVTHEGERGGVQERGSELLRGKKKDSI